MRARFIVTNVVFLALAYGVFRSGLLAQVPSLAPLEYAMIGALVAYGLAGAVLGFCGWWRPCIHIANSLPMWALGFTGVGLIMAVSGLHTLTPEAMAAVFRNLAYSIAPNIVGVMMMAWLREIAWWSDRAEV